MKAFVDTNVWLRGRFHTGLCARLLDGLVETGIELLLDERVLEEFARIAQHKFQVEDELLRRTLMFFHEYARVVPASSEPVPGVHDPDDALILAAALACRCAVVRDRRRGFTGMQSSWTDCNARTARSVRASDRLALMFCLLAYWCTPQTSTQPDHL